MAKTEPKSLLLEKIEDASHSARHVFVAGCAEHLLPFFMMCHTHFSKTFKLSPTNVVVSGIAQIWNSILRISEASNASIDGSVSEIQRAVPSEDELEETIDYWIASAFGASSSAIIAALLCREDNLRSVTLCSSFVLNAIKLACAGQIGLEKLTPQNSPSLHGRIDFSNRFAGFDEVYREYDLQLRMIEQVSTMSLEQSISGWRQQQQLRGEELASAFGFIATLRAPVRSSGQS